MEDPKALARQCAEAMYAADAGSQRLGIVITDIGPGQATATMTVTEDMVNGLGICHGGYVFALADTAMAFASNSYNERAVAAGASIDYLTPVSSGTSLVAAAVERAGGGRRRLYDVSVRTDDGTVVAEFRGRTSSRGEPLLND